MAQTVSDSPRWRFEVVAAFNISGRGTVAVGRMYGEMYNGEAAILEINGATRRLERVGIDLLCRPGGGLSSVALALPGVQVADVPLGAVIHATGTDPASRRSSS